MRKVCFVNLEASPYGRVWLTEEITSPPFSVRIPSSSSLDYADSVAWLAISLMICCDGRTATESAQIRMPSGSNCLTSRGES